MRIKKLKYGKYNLVTKVKVALEVFVMFVVVDVDLKRQVNKRFEVGSSSVKRLHFEGDVI